MRWLLAILLLIPAIAAGQAGTAYETGGLAPTTGLYGRLIACKSATHIKPAACDDNGALSVGLTSISKNEAIFGAAGSISAATLDATYRTVVDLPDNTLGLMFDNRTDGDVWVSVDNGVTNNFHVKSGDVLAINLSAMGLVTTGIVKAKDGTTPSTTGDFYAYSVK